MLKTMRKGAMNLLGRGAASIWWMMVLWMWPAIALAQAAAPQPSLRKAPPVWVGLLIMFLLLAVVMAVSLMPSKRTHQD